MALCIFNGNFGVQNDREAPVLARREGRKYLWGVSGGQPGRVVDAQAQRFQGTGTHLEQVSGKISRNCQRCSSSTSYQGRVVASILSGEAGWAKVVPAQPLVHGNVGIATVQSSVYASRNTSHCPLQDSRSGWIRYFLSRRALASPTTCRFIPAHSGLPVIRTRPSEERRCFEI